MAVSGHLSFPFLSPSPTTIPRTQQQKHLLLLLHLQTFCQLRASSSSSSRRISHYYTRDAGIITDPRNWSSARFTNLVNDNYDYGDDYDSDDEDEDDEDRSLDLLVRFIQNMFRKISKRARKAVRSVLPVSISTKLVGFSVNGVIILAFLWILKAFLEVVCTFGSLVFVSILLIRGTWSGISYLQDTRHRNSNIDGENSAWTGAQPAS
ncbi:hypothetical protein IFM89_022544 [Coptis chinensis]|uniref:Uncharacterized protein n=1 Tax=Coptis chinensis TaxID=261450 RepID=A0A835IP45_9MAGN|nr:hypothetical protein IFM89_022544 [Coptis chinensis]